MSFKLIPEDELSSTLYKILKDSLPKSARLYNVLQFHLQGRLVVKFYTFGGKLNEVPPEQIFIFAHQVITGTGDHYLTIYEPYNYSISPQLVTAFENFIDWSVPNQFGAVSPSLSNHITELCTSKGLKFICFRCRAYALELEQALKLDTSTTTINPPMKLQRLSTNDAEFISDHWKFSTPKTTSMMADSISRLGSIGLYDTGDNNKLISWILMIQSGNLFSLQTAPGAQGKGYGSAVLKGAAHYFAKELGAIPLTYVETYNVAAMSLMEKMGMKCFDEIDFIETY